MAESKYSVNEKIGKINYWRDMCDKQHQGQANQSMCPSCDEVAKEICAELQELQDLRRKVS